MPSIFLIGFMAAGKTVVGRELARGLSRPFVDLDERIEASEGASISELFASRGEQAFRALEAEALAAVIAGSEAPCVVATGGGAAARADNLEAMLAAGLVVELHAPLETLVERARAGGGPGTRPLLAAAPDEIAALLRARAPMYRRAHAQLATAESSPAELARRLARLDDVASSLGPRLARSSICALADTAYPIVTEPGCLDALGELVAAFAPAPSKLAIVSDTNVAPLYLSRAMTSLAAAGFEVRSEIVTAGESSKNPAEHARLAEALVAAGLDRHSVVVALGGGVVGDLAGYVAATLFRGVRVVQVPTSLVAMIDSSIGGKTGVNLAAGKNLLGAFWQPTLVAIDPQLLSTLSDREVRAGLGELFKYGLLDGEELWQLAVDYARDPRQASDEAAARVIMRCAAYKSAIVSRDAREQTGERALLNLGHTIGHAIEREAGYGEVLHGEAVALGLVAAARVARALGLAGADLERRLTSALSAAGIDSDIEPWLRPEVLAHVGVDKKRTGQHLAFVVVRGVGVPEIAHVAVADVAKFLLAPSSL